jgi:hypothetical protein
MPKKINKQIGGNDVVTASYDLIISMKDLGKSIFDEIYAITNIQNELNNGSLPSVGTPNVIDGPTNFDAPTL